MVQNVDAVMTNAGRWVLIGATDVHNEVQSDFSSTQSTRAFSVGFRYRATTAGRFSECWDYATA